MAWRSAREQAGLPPIVLFHDSLGCIELWRSLPEQLCVATGRDVVAYDRLGFGRSEARLGRPSLRFVAEEAEQYVPALLDHLGIERFVAMGHSVGGAMAIECAAAHPARCAALITMAAQVFPEATTLQGIRAARDQFADADQLGRLGRYHGDKTAWVLDAWLGVWLDPAFAAWSLRGALARVLCPALVIHGDQDEYGAPLHAQLISEWTAGSARVELLTGVGHLPHRERPEQVIALAKDFLE